MNNNCGRTTQVTRRGVWVAAGLLGCLLWLTGGPSQAQTTAATSAAVQQPAELTLTPAQAAELALRNSLQLQRDARSVEQAQARLKQAQALGKLTSQATATAVWAGPVKRTNAFNEGLGVALSQPLYTGHRLETQTALAHQGIAAAQALAAVTATETALAARTMAYDILRLDQLTNVASQRATAAAEQVRITRAMEAAGAVPVFEVVQAETELAKAKGDIIAAQTAAQQARSALCLILVVPQTTVLKVAEGIPLQQPAGALPELIDLGLSRRPEVALGQRQVQVAEAALQVARQSNNARIDAIAELNQGTVTSVSEPLNWTVGVAISKPLSDGGLRRGQEQEQTAKIADAKLALEALRQQISFEVAQQLQAVREAREQLTVAEAGEVNARERLRLANVRFTAGLSIGIEVLDAQAALAAAQAATVNARYGLQTSVVSLRKAIGDLDQEISAP